MPKITHQTIDAETIDAEAVEPDEREKTAAEKWAALPRSLRYLPPANIVGAEFEMMALVVTVPVGISWEMIQTPEYWQTVTSRLAPWMVLRCRSDDGSWMGDLLVQAVDRLGAILHPLNFWSLPEVDHDQVFLSLGIVPRWISVSKRYGAIRLSDGVCLQSGFGNRWEAGQWALQYSKSQARLNKVAG